jgi:hypothetical protein
LIHATTILLVIGLEFEKRTKNPKEDGFIEALLDAFVIRS